ncbi:glycosyltransferase family 2 protein [Hydrogenimonas cancrithermarum]|uniref:Glycosyltransferase 2-like domain-containing protein n=1 Tax=Hydrogenimonas cancrithermarum TaxID=2993563 RepID=A0ABN6WWB4_9BACT|nr:glycosyltransferase [Hydrogenimonas cancrithermarum]BDY13168.1 hypothetical protein HCR_14800 [Hydrogenimonas cancrithermarum]
MRSPKITVLMPVYNAQEFLGEAIESVLNQTFGDFEFLIIDDASTDDSAEIIHSFKDTRIVYLRNEINQGVARALNRGVKVAKGDYIARMDADDICDLDRLKKQYRFMSDNPEIGLCGSAIQGFGSIEREYFYPQNGNGIKALLLFNSAFAHPSVMIKRDILQTLKYRDTLRRAQDYELWTRCVHITGCANIPEVLLYYRHHDSQISSRKKGDQQQSADMIRLSYLQSIHSDFTSEDAMILGKMARREFLPYKDVERVLEKVLRLHGGFLNEKSIGETFALQYWWTLGDNCDRGIECIREFIHYYRRNENQYIAKNKMKFFVKCILKWKSK